MKPTVEELKQEQSFELIKTLPYNNILHFLTENIMPNTKTMGFFFFFLVLCAITVLAFIPNPNFSWSQIFWYGLAGFVSSFTVLVPIHELFHALAFKIFKAGKLYFGLDTKQLMFYVTVHQFVLNKKEFIVMAILPFVIVTILLLGVELLFSGAFIWFSLSAIFWHTTMCIGDFAMIAFYEKNDDFEIFTFDDAYLKEAYFYKRINY